MHNHNLDFRVLDIRKGLFKGLDGSLDIGFDNDVQVLHFPFLDTAKDIIKGNLGFLLLVHLLLIQPFFSNNARRMFIRCIKEVTGFWHIVEAQDLNGVEGPAFFTFSPRSLTMARTLP